MHGSRQPKARAVVFYTQSTAIFGACMSASATAGLQRRSFWLKTLHQWHWISSALCLIGMLLFAFTGITLNHAAQIESTPVTTTKTAQLPASLLKPLQGEHEKNAAIPASLTHYLSDSLGIHTKGREGEWSDGELYIALPKPGGDAWVSVDIHSGEISYENTERGWVSFLNDLHKGRNTGGIWTWFLDIFAVACLVFCLSGLMLLQFHSKSRLSTWPVVGLGLLIPFLLIVLFIH
jgi:hypothetical protein